jgi:DNA polymerase (family 10)
MPIQTSDVVEVFEKVADLLEIEGENRFKVRAYRDAARTVGGHSRSVAEMVEQNKDLTGRPARKDFPRLFCSPTGARGGAREETARSVKQRLPDGPPTAVQRASPKKGSRRIRAR